MAERNHVFENYIFLQLEETKIFLQTKKVGGSFVRRFFLNLCFQKKLSGKLNLRVSKSLDLVQARYFVGPD